MLQGTHRRAYNYIFLDRYMCVYIYLCIYVYINVHIYIIVNLTRARFHSRAHVGLSAAEGAQASDKLWSLGESGTHGGYSESSQGVSCVLPGVL